MTKAFAAVLNMSLSASMVILVVMLARLFLKRMPRIFSYFLWLVAFLRLLLPFVPEVDWGIVPDVRLVEIGTGFNFRASGDGGEQAEGFRLFYDAAKEGQEEMPDELMEHGTDTGNAGLTLGTVGNIMPGKGKVWSGVSYVWLAGCCALVLYGICSYVVFMKRLRACKEQKDGDNESERGDASGRGCSVILSERIKEPFVAGIIRPVIYLPAGLDRQQQELVEEHEKIHIIRKDYLIKPAAYLAVCIHWFNPLVWLAFHFMERDMEVSCDETVLKKTGYEKKKAYADTLLYLSGEQDRKMECPIAFGEKSVKSRIKNVVKLKETKMWAAIIVAVGVFAAAVLLLVNGKWNLPLAEESGEAGMTAARESDAAGIPGTDNNPEPEYIYVDESQGEIQEEEGSVVYLPAEKITVQDIPDDDQMVTAHHYYVENNLTDNYSVLLRQAEDTYKEQLVQYVCPTEPERISNAYGSRIHPVTGETIFHSGVDFAAEIGTPVYAAAEGIVVEAGQDVNCGNYVILQHDNEEMTYYANCDEIMVEAGQKVVQGEQIATVGNTGMSTGAHLHFALSRNGSYIEPVWQ